MLQAVGFNSSVEVVETATLTDLRATGDYDVFLVATMQENGEPYKYFNMRVLNDAHHSDFVDEELNAKILASNSEMDADAAVNCWKSAWFSGARIWSTSRWSACLPPMQLPTA